MDYLSLDLIDERLLNVDHDEHSDAHDEPVRNSLSMMMMMIICFSVLFLVRIPVS